MRRRPEIKRLVDWLKKDGNSATKIAMELGYKSSNTIDKWISNNKIPERSRDAVLRLIGDQNVHSESSD